MSSRRRKPFLERLLSRLAQRSSPVEFEEFTFEDFEVTDKIIVTTNVNDPVKVIEDADTIRAVLAFAKRHQSGWCVPWDGVPIALLRLNFYQGDDILGNLGVARTFLTTHQSGGFWSKDSEETEASKLLDIIGLSGYALD